MEDLPVEDMILEEERDKEPRSATDARKASCEEMAQWENHYPEEEMMLGEDCVAQSKVCILYPIEILSQFFSRRT
jgi:hypothetical protein